MVTLYRAQPIIGMSPRTAPTFLDVKYGGKVRGLGGLSLQGQYFTTDPARARNYMPTSFQKFSYFDPKLGPRFMGFGAPMGAVDPSKSITTKPGIIKSMNLSDADFEKVKSFTKKVPTLPGYQFATNLPNEFLVPKTFLKNRNPTINLTQTLQAYGDDGLAAVAAGLKKNILKNLATFASLPVQAGIMALSPTRMGNAEISQLPKAPPRILNPQGGGGRDGGYQPTTTAQNRARTASRVNSSGGIRAYGLASGGLV